MDILIILAAIVLLIVATYLYQRQRERALVDSLKQIGNDPSVAMAELDKEIEQDRERAEFWKKQSGKPLL